MADNTNLKQKLDDLKSGKLSCEQNVKDFLAEIKKNNRKYNIVLETIMSSIEIAKKLDKKRKNKTNLGSLYGLCFTIKSNISFKDVNISCASKTLESYKGTFNADVIERIIAEDGIIIAVTNNDEFASGSSGELSAFGKTDNPKSQGRIPGGTSSGSCASISANFCDIALGTDTGGSIRNPASHCGVIGVKPSYGRVSRYGLIDSSMSLDQIGPTANDLYGLKLTMEVISGHSENDSISTKDEVQKFTKLEPKKSYKIGIIEDFEKMVTEEKILKIYKENLDKLKSEGHEIISLKIKNIDLGIQAYYPLVYTEFFSGTRKYDGIKYGDKIEETAGDEVLRRMAGGTIISQSEFDGAYYKKALRVKEVIAEEFAKAFKKVDFIITPVTPKLPHKFGDKISVEDMYAYDAFTVPVNLAGICGGVISKDTVKEGNETLYVGTQVLADKFREDLVFSGLQIMDSLSQN